MEIRTMRAGERDAVLDLLESAFPGDRDIFERYLDFDPRCGPEDFLLALDGARPVACVQVFDKTVRLRGESVRLGGIGSVGTHPEHRHKGLATELLRRADDAMRARGMRLGLLFTGRISFYERLGWIPIPLRQLLVRAEGDSATPAGVTLRAFRPDDLEAVRALYATYAAGLEGATLRDARYWEGQLRYAGNPGEDFRVAERDGRIVAYARGIRLEGFAAAMEHARTDDAAEALAALIVSLDSRLLLRLGADAELERALGERAVTRRVDDVSPMWRVLDARALARLAALPADRPHRDILRVLIEEPPVHYWLSDRF